AKFPRKLSQFFVRARLQPSETRAPEFLISASCKARLKARLDEASILTPQLTAAPACRPSWRLGPASLRPIFPQSSRRFPRRWSAQDRLDGPQPGPLR